MRYAVLFPGQGSQTVGMGADVVAARPDLLGRVADEILGWSLGDLCEQGPEEELTRTDRAQPALFAVSYALWEELRAALPAGPVAAAGHSLGEYTALAAAGALGYEQGLRLVAERGRAMAAAAADGAGAMAAVLGADEEVATTIAQTRLDDGGSLWVANVNAPGQIVLAGLVADIAWLVEHVRDFGARRAIPLNVAGAFHSPLMEPAAERLGAALAMTSFAAPEFPVYANTTAQPVSAIADALTDQLVGTVRFAESLRAMAEAGVDTFVHVGPGDVTAGMARRTVPDATVLSVSSLDGIADAREALAVQ